MKLKNKSYKSVILNLFQDQLILFAITTIAFLLRIWSIDKNPPSLNWDEVSHGYNAYSILKTGRDEWGVSFPLIFRAFGDYKLPVYIYLTVLPVALFGLNLFSVRIISVIAGALAIPGIYLLTNQLFPSLSFRPKWRNPFELSLGHVSALILAISPWHFFISRPALEANLALTLFIFGLWALIKALQKSKFYLPAAILLSLTLHSYNTYRVVTPLALIAFVLIYRKTIFKTNLNNLLIPSFLFLAATLLVVQQTFSGTGTARYQKLAILSEQAVYQIGQNRLQSKLPSPLPKLIHNRPVYFLKVFTANYLSYFSPQFVYQNQGAQRQFSIPAKNLFSMPVLILALIGLVSLLIKRKSLTTDYLLLPIILFLAPVAAALTASPPQALRPTPLIIPMVVFSSLGFLLLIGIFKSRPWTKIAVSLALLISLTTGFSRYLNSYWQEYRFENSSAWQYGYKQVMEYVTEHQKEYDRVFISKYHGEPHIFYAFFSKLDPQELQPNSDNIRFNQSDWYWTDRIGEVYFVNDWQIPSYQPAKALPLESGAIIPTKNSLLITSGNHLPAQTEVIEIIEDLNGDIAFIIARFK